MSLEWEAKAWEVYNNKLGPKENIERIRNATGMPEATARVYLGAIDNRMSVSEYLSAFRSSSGRQTKIKIDVMDHFELDDILQARIFDPEERENYALILDDLFRTLTPPERGIIRDYCMHGKSYEEIGEEFGVSKQTMMSRINVALDKMLKSARTKGYLCPARAGRLGRQRRREDKSEEKSEIDPLIILNDETEF